MKVTSRIATSGRLRAAIAVCLVLSTLLTTVRAGIRGRGKYSGVVIFDRWDTCFLLSGPYITYISEAVKEELRPYAGQAVQIDVTEIIQPVNPADGLVKSYVILGQAPDDPSDPIANKVEIEAEPAFDGKSAPMFDVTVRNISLKRVSVGPSKLGPTLLGVSRGLTFSASDGKSVAWITRVDLALRGPDQTATSSWSSTVDGKTFYANYNATEPCAFKGRSRACRLRGRELSRSS